MPAIAEIEDLKKIYGGNKMRVYREVWEGIPPEDDPVAPAARRQLLLHVPCCCFGQGNCHKPALVALAFKVGNCCLDRVFRQH